MAKMDNLFESSQGKLGNLIFYKVGESGRVRMKAANFKDRKSPAQLAQRQKLGLMLAFMRPLRDLIRITFAAEAVGRSAMQAAQSYNMRNALAGEYPDVNVDMSRVLLSSGPLPLPVNATVTAQSEGLLIEWENGAEAAGQRATDTLLVIARSAETGSVDYQFTEARRSVGRYVWKPALPKENNALPDVWIAFRNRQETQMSQSLLVER